jgi:hypothetical protein
MVEPEDVILAENDSGAGLQNGRRFHFAAVHKADRAFLKRLTQEWDI